ncbi:MAG: bifunctional folylpolyglutamate synthase/dihydrofolate synthase [Paludibacteraceae bacterium]|nr:bifunctional folylpolyglutamate synthase/dihydrofolate synthase [Paludibacteraceae bacterium]
MTYQQTLEYIYSSHPAFHLVGADAYKPGLDNMLRVMRLLGNPHLAFPAVHIAGTNGKGSTSHLIAAALQASGLRVGLYTSPHLVDFRERIKINGQMIPEQRVCRFVEGNKQLLEDAKLSFFEVATSLAFVYFAEEKVDVAVIEVGLGGRLDATNIIRPLLSVITNIGLDHTDLLGNTLARIAAEKAGIIKCGVPCVIGEVCDETMPVFEAKARECGIWGEGPESTTCRLWLAEQCNYLRKQRYRIAPECQLKGAYQERNMQTAYVALRALDTCGLLKIPYDCIRNGFANVCSLTGLRGRWETLCEKPLVICDTGHNAHGVRAYIGQLDKLMEQRRAVRNMSQQQAWNVHLRIVFGMVKDKDVAAVLDLLPREAVYYWTQGNTHRALPADEIRSLGLSKGLIGKAYPNVKDALTVALNDAASDDVVFIGGSNYVVGEALAVMNDDKCSKGCSIGGQ